MHCFRGLGVERTMLQSAIVPADAKPIHFNDYETGMERWVSLISQALQYRINLPDPTAVLAYYENIILGGTSPTGTLEQYPGIQRKYLAWKDEHDLVYLRASHGDRFWVYCILVAKTFSRTPAIYVL